MENFQTDLFVDDKQGDFDNRHDDDLKRACFPEHSSERDEDSGGGKIGREQPARTNITYSFVYLFAVLHHTQKYLTHTTAIREPARAMERGRGASTTRKLPGDIPLY